MDFQVRLGVWLLGAPLRVQRPQTPGVVVLCNQERALPPLRIHTLDHHRSRDVRSNHMEKYEMLYLETQIHPAVYWSAWSLSPSPGSTFTASHSGLATPPRSGSSWTSWERSTRRSTRWEINLEKKLNCQTGFLTFQKEPNYGTTAEVAREPREVPSWRKVINFLCGIGSSGGDRQVSLEHINEAFLTPEHINFFVCTQED